VINVSSRPDGNSSGAFLRHGVVAVFIDEVWEPDDAVKNLRELVATLRSVRQGATYASAPAGTPLFPYCIRRSGTPSSRTDVTADIGTRPAPHYREVETEYLWVLSKKPELGAADLDEIAQKVWG
jgi:hypothetical protein